MEVLMTYLFGCGLFFPAEVLCTLLSFRKIKKLEEINKELSEQLNAEIYDYRELLDEYLKTCAERDELKLAQVQILLDESRKEDDTDV